MLVLNPRDFATGPGKKRRRELTTEFFAFINSVTNITVGFSHTQEISYIAY